MPSDIAFSDLQFIIDFVYRGEIDVSEAELQVSEPFIIYYFTLIEINYKTPEHMQKTHQVMEK